jgi:hypothetical protein
MNPNRIEIERAADGRRLAAAAIELRVWTAVTT